MRDRPENVLTLRQRGYVWRYVLVASALVVVAFPVAYTIRLALKPFAHWTVDRHGFGGPVTLENFRNVVGFGGLDQGFINSLVIVVPGALAATLVAAFAGFALSKLRPPGGRIVFGIILVAIAAPVPAIILPLFVQGLALGYALSRQGLVIVYAGLFSSWATFYMYAYFRSIPQTLIDIARADGASNLRIFWSVALPLAKPAVIIVFVFNFIAGWNDLLVALVMLQAPDQRPVTVAVAILLAAFATNPNLPQQASALLFAAIPPLMVFAAAQPFLRGRLLAGAVKE